MRRLSIALFLSLGVLICLVLQLHMQPKRKTNRAVYSFRLKTDEAHASTVTTGSIKFVQAVISGHTSVPER